MTGNKDITNQYKMFPDVYFMDSYPELYARIENGTAEKIEVNNVHGSIVSHVIKREIPIDCSEKYFDLVTPYGYGGPIITSLTGDKSELVHSFEEEMKRYVEHNNIVSEFVRFHPIIENALDFKSIYNPVWDRKTVGTNLRDYSIDDEFSKSAKKYIRRALKAGVHYEIIQNPDNIDDFIKIYYSTMDRDNADDYYYFDKEYFTECLAKFGDHVLYVKVMVEDNVIAAGFYFVCDEILECHLSGTLTEFLHLSPAYITKIATAEWAAENGVSYIHYGGGTSRDENNSLYQFKKKFGQNTEFDFYIGKKVWNDSAYRKLCDVAKADVNSNYFPAYRSK